MFHFHFLPDIEKWKKENLCQFSFFNENKLHAFCFFFVLCPVPFVIMSKRFLELNKMAAIESLLDSEVVRELVENSHRTFEEISEVLQAEFPNKRGLSVKSWKGYCHMHEIKRRQNVADNELDEVVKSAVEQVSLLLFPLESCFGNLMIFLLLCFSLVKTLLRLTLLA